MKGLSPSTTYRFTVSAADAAGNTSATSPPLTVTTGADPGINPATWYQVINQNSGKCVDATDWGTGNGTGLQQWTCNTPAAANQLWQFRPTNNDYYEVVGRDAPTQAWDVTGGPGATGNGVPIQLWNYIGGTNQQWRAAPAAGGYHTFLTRNSAKCLDVTDVSRSDRARLQQWECTGGPAQTFRLVPQP